MKASARWVSVSALVVTGCASCSQTDTTTASPADASFDNDTSNPQDSAVADVTPQSVEDVHFIGRFDTSDPKQPLFAYPGTAISTRFTGTGIDVALADTGKNWFDVIVDNGTPSLLQTGGKTSFTLASNLAMGTHDVTIVKRTEGFVGSVRFSGFTPKGGAIVASPFPYARRIEMIGDSITCGYGVLGANATCPFSADTESETAAWGALASKQLNAAHTAIAYSGRGLYRNFDGTLTDPMTQMWRRIVPDDSKSVWDFARYTPNVVVIDLGTNDYATGDPGMPYQDAYVAFLKKLRSTYPSAHIVAALGVMLGANEQAILKGYVQSAISATGDPNVSLLEMTPQDGTDGFGCDYHPSAARQQKMAAALVTHLKQKLGW